MAVILLAVTFLGIRYLHWFRQEAPQDSVQLSDPAVLSAVREAVGGGPITEESLSGIVSLRMKSMPENWNDLALLPALESLEIPQQLVQEADTLPDGYTIELTGGGTS